ncbi:MAG: hypothetical protein E7182_02245 [Erysipelotrichaceae bacterium]|nr:hypothetical protein [Erysipelotrichaceae bacterium]
METRMERYAKYREQIKRMAPEDFAPKKETDAEEAKEHPLDFSYAESEQTGDGKANTAPYALYLRRRRRFLVAKIVALIVVIGLFILWWFLMQGRK